jgi:hypothetical protein
MADRKKPKAVPRSHQRLPHFVKVVLNPWMKKRGDRGDRKK